MSLDFLRIDGVMIQKVGLDAAVLHALIDWRSARYRTRVWVASIADITDDTGLSRRRIQVARDVLTEAGMLVCERGPQSSLHWSTDVPDEAVLRPHVTGLKPDVAVSTSYREDIEDNYPADAPLSATDQETVMTDVQPSASVTPIDGGLFPAEPVTRELTPEEMANRCRDAWRDAYTAAHGRPHPVTRDRAFGQIRTMVKACEQPDDFREVWRAAHAAGEAGEWAVMNRLGPPPQSRRAPQQNPLSVMVAASYAEGAYDHLMPGRELGQ